jgi:hypothetical protein
LTVWYDDTREVLSPFADVVAAVFEAVGAPRKPTTIKTHASAAAASIQ